MSNKKTPRERAESHFGTMPLPVLARQRVLDELDAIKAVRDEKTQRLRQARLARDGQDRKQPTAPAPSDRPKP